MKRGVIELLVSPREARKSPWLLAALAFVFISTGVIVNIWLPVIQGAAIVFAMVPSIPLIWSLLIREEHEEEERLKLLQSNSFAYHLPLLEVFAFFFLGATVAYTFWYAALPPELSQKVFASQLEEIKNIGLTVGSIVNWDFAVRLFEHNVMVLAFMLAFSLIYGIGSVYLLLWNASIIGVFVGSRLQTGGVEEFLRSVGGILAHGSLEVGAYFVATIAGGIISAAIMRRHAHRPHFKLVLLDAAKLLVAAVLMLAAAALLEAT